MRPTAESTLELRPEPRKSPWAAAVPRSGGLAVSRKSGRLGLLLGQPTVGRQVLIIAGLSAAAWGVLFEICDALFVG